MTRHFFIIQFALIFFFFQNTVFSQNTTQIITDTLTQNDSVQNTITESAPHNAQAEVFQQPIEPLPIDPNARVNIAVMDFKSKNSAYASILADRFGAELMLAGKFNVMERNQMQMILQEQEFQQSDCVNQSCAVEIGQLIAVQKIFTGMIAKVGDMFTVNIKMLDVETGRIDKNESMDCDCPIEQVVTTTLRDLARRMAGLEQNENQGQGVFAARGDASLYIKTEPEGARIYIDGRFMQGRTPITLESLPPGECHVQVSKDDLQASGKVVLENNQVKRLSFKLEKPKTILRVMSEPSEAEVCLRRRPSRRLPDRITPAIFENLSNDSVCLSLFKLGFTDTLLCVPLLRNKVNEISINLGQGSPESIKLQKKMLRSRAQRPWGFHISYISLATLAAGGASAYLAYRDFQDALAASDYLVRSSIHSGQQYEAKKKENEDKTSSGNLKSAISAALLGVGGVGLCVGLVLYF
ncbi:MAG: PEGA domain-containing protein [Fibrobacteria bacterium]|nr:PEGA domain-containing protein [Fibrobacteria bacterium]